MINTQPKCHQNGFSLVEITIVLVIASIVLTMGVSVLTAAMESVAHSVTAKRQELIKDALTSYLGRNRRLPCPDLPGAVGNAPGTGDDNRATPNDLTTTCASRVGIVPYIDLGLSRDNVIDGWDNFITYVVTIDGSAALDWSRSTTFLPGKPGNLNILLRDPATSATTTNITDPEKAVVVIISHGPNGFGAWTSQSTGNVAPAGTDEITNTSGGTDYIKREPSTNGALVYGAYDDKVVYLKSSELIAGLVKDGSVRTAEGETRKLLGETQDGIIGASIGTATLPATYIMPVDGWGTPLIYTRIIASQITNASTGTAFTVTSAGPNRIDNGGAVDDIIVVTPADPLKVIYGKAGTLPPPIPATPPITPPGLQ
jgi:prepilin-type N-terminal cleavage/methylation domain-containing protein